ncbi:MAG: right-handed parallel beta-helix repeat-containing protein [Armatimonadetes bacterium]|nr:right-handed parallel beta-helix repeat-containing protein [Armatimonadota bacterium]
MQYHISTELGDDENPGTSEKPWKTLARANAHHYENDDKLLLRAGETFPGFLRLSPDNVTKSDSERFIVQAYNLFIGSDESTPRPIIEAGTESGITIRNLSRIRILDIDVRGSGHDTNTGWGVCILNDAPGAERLDYVTVSGVRASGFRWAGIYVGGIPNDLPGFDTPADCRHGFSNVTINKCEAFGNMYYGIYVSGRLSPDMTDYANTNVEIDKCKAYDNPGDKFYTENHSGSGILLDNCQTGLILNCEAWNNGAENGGLNGGPCGIWAHCGDRIVVQYCRSHGNRTGGSHDGTGFDLDGGVTNSIIEHCESWDNDGPGFLVWNYENAPFTLSGNIFRDCTSTNDGRKHNYGGIHIGTSGEPVTDMWVRDCQVTQTVAPDGNRPPCLWIGAKVQNAVLRGNTLVADHDAPGVVIESGAENIVQDNQ